MHCITHSFLPPSILPLFLPPSLPPSLPLSLSFSSLQTSEKEMLIREMGEERVEVKGQDASEQVIYKIDIPANRFMDTHTFSQYS